MSVLRVVDAKTFNLKYKIHKEQVILKIFIFCILQLSIWHGGLAEIIPSVLLSTWNIFQMIAVFVLVIFFIINNRIPNKISILLLFMKLFSLTIAIFNRHGIDLVETCRYVGIILSIDYFFEDFTQLIKSLMLIFEILVYYNLVSLVGSEKNIYGVYFSVLGYDNDFTRYMIVAYFIAMLYYLITEKKGRSIILILGTHITLIYAGVATGIMAMLIMDILLVISNLRLFNFTIRQSFIVYLITEVSIVFLKVQNFFSYIIVELLNKDLTFTGRITVWEKSIDKFLDRPLFGFGDMNQLTEQLILGDVYCHNGFLELAFRGGVIQLVLFICIVYVLDKATKQYFDRHTISICAVALSGIWVTSLLESIFHFEIIMGVFALIYSACMYIKAKKNSNNKIQIYSTL